MFIEERTYYPDGCDPDDMNAHGFGVTVAYRGNGLYLVARGGRSAAEQLSKTGKWLWYPLKMTQMRWCRFDFEEACRLAESVVNDVVVNGRTWNQWQAHFAALKKEKTS